LKPIYIFISAPLLTVALPACTSQQLTEAAYNSLQGRQREECNKIPAGSDRDRCVGRNSTTYDEYKRQSDAVKQ
jgi:hypothetical protein